MYNIDVEKVKRDLNGIRYSTWFSAEEKICRFHGYALHLLKNYVALEEELKRVRQEYTDYYETVQKEK